MGRMEGTLCWYSAMRFARRRCAVVDWQRPVQARFPANSVTISGATEFSHVRARVYARYNVRDVKKSLYARESFECVLNLR